MSLGIDYYNTHVRILIINSAYFCCDPGRLSSQRARSLLISANITIQDHLAK